MTRLQYLSGLSLLILALIPLLVQADRDPTVWGEGVTILQSSDAGIRLQVTMPEVSLTPTEVEGQAFQQVTMAGYGDSFGAGQPDLPQKGLLIGVPIGADVAVRVVSAETRTLSNITPLPVPHKELLAYDPHDAGSLPEFAEHYTPAYAETGGDFPTSPVSVSTPTWLRDQRIATVRIFPVQANVADQTLRVYEQLEIEITFDGAQTSESRPESEVFDKLFAANMLNYDVAQQWRSVPPLGGDTAVSPCFDGNAYRIDVETTGIYEIRANQLNGLPGGVDIDSVRMCHLDSEIAVTISDSNTNGVFDGNDQLLFYGEAVKTHDTETNVYWLTHSGANGLRMGTIAGSGSGTIDAEVGHNVHLETDTVYFSQFPRLDPDDLYDHWFQSRIGIGEGISATDDMTFSADNRDASENVTISAELWGWTVTNNAHKFQFELNGTPVGGEQEFSADGYDGPEIKTIQVSGSLLVNGTNTLTIRALPNGVGVGAHSMLINWAEVTFQRAPAAIGDHLGFAQATTGDWQYNTTGFAGTPTIFDVTDSNAPQEVTGAAGGTFAPDQASTTFPASYQLTDNPLSPASMEKVATPLVDLTDTGISADYIIITDPVFDTALQPLIDHHTGRGLDVEVVHVSDIFDQFGYGLYATDAIRLFLEFAYVNWVGGSIDDIPTVPPPSYVLLAGDGSYDHRDVMGLNQGRNLVPVYLRSAVDQWLGEAAADNHYVAFMSSDSFPDDVDSLPFMNLGRLPAENSAEMTAMVNKIIAYDNQTTFDPSYHATHFFTSDNQLQDTRQTGCAIDPATLPPNLGFFDIINTFVANHVAPYNQLVDRLFFARCHENDDPLPSWYAFDPLDFSIRFVETFNEGAGFVNYTGHSGVVFWADERIASVDLLDDLANGDELPIMLPMTCLEGQYHRFDLVYNSQSVPNGLSEGFVKQANAGAVASYAPTGLSVATSHDFLIEGFYDALFADGQDELGAAIFTAKLNLSNNGSVSYQDLHHTFMLLGDPAMDVKVSVLEQVQLPIIVKE